MSSIVKINDTDLQVLEYQDQRVVTLAQVDAVHERPEGTAGRNYREHKHRLVEGEDFHRVGADEFRRHLDTTHSKFASEDVILLTEQGYLMLVKSFTDELAWQVQRQIVTGYFRGKEAEALPPPAEAKSVRIRSTTEAQKVAAQIRALTMVTREIIRVPGVRHEAAATAFLTMVERATGLQVSDLRHALPGTPSEVAFQLNPTHLAKRVGIPGLKAAHINLALVALGFQQEGERDYVVTEKGARFGEMRSYTNQHNGHQGYQSVWSVTVVPILETYFADHPSAALPFPKPQRKSAKKKDRAVEPQGALL